MRSPGDLVRYLNGFFAPEIWRAAGNLVGNLTVSELADRLREAPGVSGFGDPRAQFDQPPAITLVDDTHVRVRIPNVGRHRVEGDVLITDPAPDSHLTAEFSIELVAGSNPPNPQIDIGIDIQTLTGLARIAFAALNPFAFAIMVAVEEIVEEIIPGLLEEEVQEKLGGGLGSFRFDRTNDLVWPGSSALAIEGVWPASFHGSQDPATPGYVDLLLVADGVTAADLRPFDTLAMALANRFAPASAAAPAPFYQYRSAIRVWKMGLVATDPADPLERAVVPVMTDRATLNFSNLARVAEIGLMADAAFAHHPIVIFMSRVTVADRDLAGMDHNAEIRANSQGPFLVLELPSWGPAAIDTIIHELGHSPVGHHLADEYPDAPRDTGCTFEVGEKLYRGPEPRPRNVTTNPLLGWAKWQPWSPSLVEAHANIHMGGYEHDLGILRFQDVCRMRCRDESDFCAICREELALGLLEHGHLRAGTPRTPGRVDLLVEYLAPWTQPQPDRISLDGGSTTSLEVLSAGVINPATSVRLTLAGSSVPETWDVRWNISRNADGTFGPLSGNSVEVTVRPGALVELTVRHDQAATGILAASRPTPATSVRLLFDRERHITANDLRPPTELRQSVPVGAVLVPVIDTATGQISLPEPLWIEARNGGMDGYDLATAISFYLEGPGAYQVHHDSPASLAGVVRRWTITRMPPRGHYAWSACTTWRGITGPCVTAPRSPEDICWEIAAIPFAVDPQPPADPFDLQLVETATFPPLPVGLQASSWHPNDRRINFQFELKSDAQPFDEQGLLSSGFQARDHSNSDSLAVTGRAFFNLLPRPGSTGDLYHWRVRAVDDVNTRSSWVEGRPFLVYLPTGSPRTLQELAEILEDLRILELLDPRGPLDVPRLFMASGEAWPFSSEDETDFSRLKELARRRRPRN